MKINTVGVVGAGVMGVGLSQSLIETGHDVVLVDVSEEQLQKAMNDIRQNLRLAKMMKRLDKDVDTKVLLEKITTSTRLESMENADFIVENACEKWQTKADIYPVIDEVVQPNCVFAANTSAISITKIAGLTKRPEKVLGMHFMNPVPLKAMVETIRGFHTSDETIATSELLLEQMGKKAVVVNDLPGFVSNRLSHLLMNEAAWVLQDQVADAKSIDTIFTDGFEHKMGPLATADLIGLDTVLNTLEILYDSYKDPKFRPAPLLRKLVDAGKLGRKSGEGFFKY